MNRIPLLLLGAVACACLALVALTYSLGRSFASDHQDSPAMVGRPGADITDVFVFPAADPNKVVLAMDIHPLIPRGMSGGVVFDPGVMYQFKINTTGNYRENRVIQFKAVGTGSDQYLEMYGPAAPATPGTLSNWVGAGQRVDMNRTSQLSRGVVAFAGARQDPFYFDLAQFFKIVPDRNYKNHPNVPAPSAKCFRNPGVDFLADYNVLSLIVELPRAMLARPGGKLGIIHVYATTSTQTGGEWKQIERLGRPAVKEAFQAFQQHDATNRTSPWKDPGLADSIVSFMMASPPNGAGRSAELARAVRNVLIPDELTADLGAGGPARYLAVETNGKSALPTGVVRAVPNSGLQGLKKSIADKSRAFGGRDFSSPVIDLSLGVIFGSLGPKVGIAPDDGKETACLTSDNVTPPGRGITQTFPYAGAPI